MEGRVVKKPKILCLHGYGYSAATFKKQVQVWPEFVLETMDLVFIDGPFPLDNQTHTPAFKWFDIYQVYIYMELHFIIFN